MPLLDKFVVTMASWFLSIRSKEICKSRDQITMDMLYKDGNGIRFRVRNPMHVVERKLLERFLALRMKLFESIQNER